MAVAVPTRFRSNKLRADLAYRSDDDGLVARVRAGDETAFATIYERYHGKLLAFCRHMVGSREEAEDVLQHTFASAYRALCRTEEPVALRPWLYTIARNRCLSTLRARVPETDLDGADGELRTFDGLAAEVHRRSELRDLVHDLKTLPEEQRAALVLFELGDHSHEEIAHVLGVRREKVKALVFQAREGLMRARRGRDASCHEIREQLAISRGSASKRSLERMHVDRCPACAAYAADVRRQRAALAAVLPVLPSVGLKSSVLGSILGGGGLAAAGGGAAGGGAAVVTGAGGAARARAARAGHHGGDRWRRDGRGRRRERGRRGRRRRRSSRGHGGGGHRRRRHGRGRAGRGRRRCRASSQPRSARPVGSPAGLRAWACRASWPRSSRSSPSPAAPAARRPTRSPRTATASRSPPRRSSSSPQPRARRRPPARSLRPPRRRSAPSGIGALAPMPPVNLAPVVAEAPPTPAAEPDAPVPAEPGAPSSLPPAADQTPAPASGPATEPGPAVAEPIFPFDDGISGSTADPPATEGATTETTPTGPVAPLVAPEPPGDATTPTETGAADRPGPG